MSMRLVSFFVNYSYPSGYANFAHNSIVSFQSIEMRIHSPSRDEATVGNLPLTGRKTMFSNIFDDTLIDSFSDHLIHTTSSRQVVGIMRSERAVLGTSVNNLALIIPLT